MKHIWSKATFVTLGIGRVSRRECLACRGELFVQAGVMPSYARGQWWCAAGSYFYQSIRFRPPCVQLPGVVSIEPDPLQVWADDGGPVPEPRENHSWALGGI